MNEKSTPRTHSRFWFLLCVVLSFCCYRYSVLLGDRDPVAALMQAGAAINVTATFGSVHSIEGGNDLTDSDLRHLQRLKSLKERDLESSKITDSGLIYLAGLSRLTVLRLKQTQVTDDGVAKLKRTLPDCKIIVE